MRTDGASGYAYPLTIPPNVLARADKVIKEAPG